MFGKKLPKKEADHQKETDSYKIERSLLSDAYFQLKDTTKKLEESREKLRRSEEHFRRLAENAPDVIYRMSLPDGRYEYMSPASLAVFGYSPEEFYKTPLLVKQIIHPDWRDYFNEQWKNLIIGKVPPSYEFQIIHKSGAVRWLNQRNILARDNIGNPISIEGIVTDITERKLLEEDLKASELKYETLVESGNDGVLIIYGKGILAYVNSIICEMTGYTKEESIGTSFLNYISPKCRKMVAERYERRMKGQDAPDKYEIEIISKSGKLTPVEINVSKIEFEGEPAIMAMVRDITERKLLEEELLKASEDRYKALFLSSRDAIMTLEPPSWRFTSGNPATLEMFKIKNEGEFLASDPWKLSPKFQPDGQPSNKKAKEMIEEAMSSGKNFFEWTHRRANGEDFPAEVLLSRVEQGGKAFLHAVVRDITERKLVEEKLKEYEEERFKVVFDNANDGMVLVDAVTHEFSLGNSAFCKMLGYSPEEIKKLSIPDIHPKEALSHALEQFEKQSRRELELAEDLPVKRKDGSIFYADINASPITINGKKFVLGIFRDITERKAAGEALRRSENFLNKIIENIPNMIFVKDVEALKFTRLNKAGEELLGYSEKDLLGKNDYDFWPKEQADFFTLKDREMLKKKELVDIPEEKIQTKNKGERTLHTRKIPVLDDAGRPIFVLGISEDVTERKKAEERLRRVNRALMTISEANQISVRAVNEDKLLRDVCDVLVKNAGYRMVWVGYAENDENKSVKPMAWAGYTDGYIEKLNVSWADVERGRGPVGTAIRERRMVVDADFTKDPNFKPWLKDALKRGYASNAVMPLFSDGNVFGAISIYASEPEFFDSDEIKMLEELAGDLAFSIMSIRNKAEKERADMALLKRTQELQQFQIAVTNASDHIIITSPDAKILFANKGVEHITGYSAAEIIGKTPAVWGHQMPAEFYKTMWKRIKEEKQPFVGQITNRRKNGELYQAESSISPILDDAGNIIYFVGVERDITKEKEVDRSKSEFVSLASHQLRTPLSAINWYAEMLLGGDAGALTEKQKDYTSEIYASSKRMAELVGALLNVSRIELGTFAIEPKPTDIRDVSDSVIKELEQKITSKNQAIVHEYSKEVPGLLNIDPNLTRMILQNLISNAVKYTPDGGRIIISLSKSNDDILIKVSDNGYGIPPAQQRRVFEKFFRADNIIPIETDGTGLGLYIVKEVVEKSGGSIRFDSEENVGTTFYVSIPISGMKKKEGARSLGG